jgi:SecD/SecF fusion protein
VKRRSAAAIVLTSLVAACSSGSTGVQSGNTASTQTATFEVPAGSTPALVIQTANVMQRRFDELSIDHVSINVHGEQITVELPAGARGKHALVVAARSGDLEMRPLLSTRDPGAALVGPPDREAFVPNTDGSQVFDAGPAAVLGSAIERASATENAGRWVVDLVLSEPGIEAFNSLAAACFNKAPLCPTQRIAVVVESLVISSPTIQSDHFERDEIQISDSFSEADAKDLAAVLTAGALPVSVTRVDG